MIEGVSPERILLLTFLTTCGPGKWTRPGGGNCSRGNAWAAIMCRCLRGGFTVVRNVFTPLQNRLLRRFCAEPEIWIRAFRYWIVVIRLTSWIVVRHELQLTKNRTTFSKKRHLSLRSTHVAFNTQRPLADTLQKPLSVVYRLDRRAQRIIQALRAA